MADLIDQEFVNSQTTNPLQQIAFKDWSDSTRNSVFRQIDAGIIQGESIRDIVKNIQKTLGVSLSRLERIVRTELKTVVQGGKNKEFLDAREQGVDARMQLIATLDDVTRPQSQDMDGNFSNNKGEFLYPDGVWRVLGDPSTPARWRINDRETQIETIDGISPSLRRSREDGIIPFQTYDQWAKDKGLPLNVSGSMKF